MLAIRADRLIETFRVPRMPGHTLPAKRRSTEADRDECGSSARRIGAARDRNDAIGANGVQRIAGGPSEQGRQS